ncbi:LETM1 domain-containing protein 1 [Helicoverpa zea]|uniref:LETM1 domain-containing protein 1 n=1 Tax=Helicoverpa zea TaxID=7113 RepID=UPI001F5A816A|nr:LETM1 domain-containing protein 1 [Helicoverpa zea]
MPLQRIVALSTTLVQNSRPSFILSTKHQQLNKYKCLTINRLKHTKVLKSEKEKLRTYVVQRYIDYVKNYTKVLENRFPTAVKMYRVFSVGIKDFLRDLKTYISLRIKVTRDQGFSNMSRQDIELFQKMPSDMWRIAPVLILSAVPFGNYVIFPLAFLKPRSLLCSHFWSIQQKLEFSTQDLVERLRNNKPVFRALQAKVDSIKDKELKLKWKRIVGLLGSGVHPKPEDILSCKELFVNEPYQLSSLTYAHAGYLLKMHGLRKTIFRRNKLKYRAFLLLEMDKAIIREGGVDSLPMETLRNACLIRGLNGSHLTNQEMKNWLQNWLLISQNVDKTSYSLLLHTPIFLAYNHPQNWVLIY